ncbi:MAG: amidohydrolase family protein [Verrucomicrobia bacterium]|nr:amidohydrolase family protein [Verrucomicrobiota bacterium]
MNPQPVAADVRRPATRPNGAPFDSPGQRPAISFGKNQSPERAKSESTAALTRRDFLTTATALAAATTFAPSPLAAATAPAPDGLIDTNAYLGRWPYRRLPLDEPAALVAKLREHGVTQAWAAHLDALLHKDLSSANARLVADCARHGAGLLIPVGTVNPAAPGWEVELRRCAEVHRMPALRLFPNYHGYKLTEPSVERALALAAELGLLVQLAVSMEDERMMHPLGRVTTVDPTPLVDLAKKIPALRLQLLNALRSVRGAPLLALAAQRVHVEFATLESVEGLATLLKQLPPDRLCFGSYAPVFYFESSILKLRESVLAPDHLAAIRSANARRLL